MVTQQERSVKFTVFNKCNIHKKGPLVVQLYSQNGAHAIVKEPLARLSTRTLSEA